MKVELLHIADCPNIDTARQLLKAALRELGLREVNSEVEVCDSAEAEALPFRDRQLSESTAKTSRQRFPHRVATASRAVRM